MEIRWYGHSSFAIIDNNVKLITDPYIPGSYGGAVGYAPINDEADIVTASHKHEDHYGISEVKGNPTVVEKEGIFDVKGFHIEMIKSFHDPNKGELRGENLIAHITTPSGITVIHFGDQGVIPDEHIINKLKGANIILIPIGGTFTIDSKEAIELIDKINPNIVIPMHYKTQKLGFDIDPIDNFLYLVKDYEERDSLIVEFNEIKNFDKKIIVLKYMR